MWLNGRSTLPLVSGRHGRQARGTAPWWRGRSTSAALNTGPPSGPVPVTAVFMRSWSTSSEASHAEEAGRATNWGIFNRHLWVLFNRH